MKTICIVQARMGSTRLPGKMLMDLGGKPVLEWVIRAARAVTEIDEVWVATTWLKEDEPIWQFCGKHKVPHIAGPPENVLKRFQDIARLSLDRDEGMIVRLTGDCPFLDPGLIGLAIRHKADTTHCWPDGMDVQVFTAEQLDTFDDKEHVVPEWHRAVQLLHLPSLRHVRVTLDTPEDLTNLRSIAEHLPTDRPPKWEETIAALQQVKRAA